MIDTLYVSDLDGTLLDRQPALSALSRSMLQELLREGLPFTIASARSVVSMRMLLTGLKLSLPIIEFNGAFITDLVSGHHEIINSLDPDIVEDIYMLIHSFQCVPFISSFNGLEDCVYYGDIINAGMQWYLSDRLAKKDQRLRAIETLTDSFHDQIVSLSVIGHADVLSELEIAVKERHGDQVETYHYENHYSPGWYWLTIHDQRATKAQAIQVMRECYSLNHTELIVFGDENNDIEMFKIADRAIAVANATTQLKRYATEVIGSNLDDSVMKYIFKDWNKNKILKIKN